MNQVFTWVKCRIHLARLGEEYGHGVSASKVAQLRVDLMIRGPLTLKFKMSLANARL